MTETRTVISVIPVGVIAVFLAQLSVVASTAAEYDVGSIHIAQPWSRATPKGAKRALATAPGGATVRWFG